MICDLRRIVSKIEFAREKIYSPRLTGKPVKPNEKSNQIFEDINLYYMSMKTH